MEKALGRGHRREAYVARINRVIDFKEIDIGEERNLVKLSRIASFSPFHFHRIF